MFDIPAAITSVSTLVTGILNRVLPDPTEKQKAELEEFQLSLNAALQSLQGQFAVIIAEAKGEGFLQRNWRPFTMLIFVGLVVSYFFGFQGVNFGPEDAAHLWSLIELGLGGYVIGRSAEKIVPEVAKALKDMRK